MLWSYWTRQDILFVDCSANLNADSTKDCLISGKGGVLCTVDGKTGTLIWELTKSTVPNLIDIYSAQYISDLDGDGFNEILIAHTSDQSGHLIILSGRGGELIGQLHSPDKEGLFTAPRVLVTKDGSYSVIFATGAFDSPGAIYSVPLTSIAKSQSMVDSGIYKIWQGPLGVSSGFVIADMTGDGYDDVIFTTGSSLMVLNSDNFTVHWNVSSYRGADTTQKFQISVGPSLAYYDGDNIPDLLVTHSVGSSFPTYYYSQTWVASGKNGEQLLLEPLMGSSDMNAPGISISFTGKGNDMFLFWVSSCNVPATQMKMSYSFVKGSSMQDKANADLCKLRFNKTLELQLFALNQHIEPPGFQLYSSVLLSAGIYWDIEHNNSSVPTYKDVKRPSLEWSEGGSEPFNQVTIKRPKYLPYPPKGADENMDAFPQYPEMQVENTRNDVFPINVNLGDSALDYSLQEPPLRGMKMDSVLDGRNERRTLRSAQDEGPRTLPRASATATLAKPLETSGIDVVFATHWETPAANVRIVTAIEELCIKNRIEAAKIASELDDLNVEVVEETAARECLPQYNDEDSDAGQLTVYRFGFKCQCSNLRNGEVCSQPLPISHQSFPHRATEVYFKARH
uniref:Protein ITFG3 n=1 Tax=Lygus hesperus TaxID=30085 RepID=A0A0A9ZHQ8_LYGHE